MNFTRRNKSEAGQGAIELLLVIALVAATIAIVYTTVGAELIGQLGPAGLDNVLAGIATVR